MKEEIIRFANTLDIEYTGIAPASPMEELREILESRRKMHGVTPFEEKDITKRTDPSKTLAGAKSIIVCLFPYFSGLKPEINISKYACVTDYHNVVMERLLKICEFIKKRKDDAKLLPFTDTGPLADKYLAYLAGLGFFGKNTMLINPKYGSYCFIGYIITDLELAPDKPLTISCDDCGACVSSCPGGALSCDTGLCAEKCVSCITQQKEITPEQKEILERQNSVYGCDICQDICPHNREVAMTPIAEFSVSLGESLDKSYLELLSNREFKERFGSFPFAWRGKSAILKNFGK